jgi:hypothetical protein
MDIIKYRVFKWYALCVSKNVELFVESGNVNHKIPCLQMVRTMRQSISTAPPVSGIANGRDVYTFLLPGFSGIEPVYPGWARYTERLYRFFGHHFFSGIANGRTHKPY